MDMSNYERSLEVPTPYQQIVPTSNGYGIPANAYEVIRRHAMQGGWPVDVFLGVRPWPGGDGRHRMVHARWECWAELRTFMDAEGKHHRYSLPRIGVWFGGLDHTTVLHGLDPVRRGRARLRYERERAMEGKPTRVYRTRSGTPLYVIPGDAV